MFYRQKLLANSGFIRVHELFSKFLSPANLKTELDLFLEEKDSRFLQNVRRYVGEDWEEMENRKRKEEKKGERR